MAVRPPSEVTPPALRECTALGCVYSRHQDGEVRHRWAAELVATTEPSVVPFVVQLAASTPSATERCAACRC